MKSKVYNFSSGPACLPENVLKKAAAELLESDVRVMEMSHRSRPFEEILERTEANFRQLMRIPDNYRVLFLQGGASLQFAMVPMNLMQKKACYVDTGMWSTKAIAEAKRFGEVTVLASSADKNFSYIPEIGDIPQDMDYIHITSNNTIYGTRYTEIPNTENVPLISDMSSCILSEEFDVSKFGMIYAGAQKNIGIAGLTIVIIREDLIGNSTDIPTMLNYKTHVDNGSMFNTPPTYAIYIAGLVFEELLSLGGVAAMECLNKQKAALLYDFLDSSSIFSGTANKKDRSLMNIPFVAARNLDSAFLAEAEANGMVNLKGHRAVGGMRASIYNAMPIAGVEKLVGLMRDFEARN